MFKKFDGVSNDDIKQYENLVKMILPKDYREFLINTNGGEFVNDIHTFWVEELKENIGIDILFSVKHKERGLCLDVWYDEYKDELLENMIIIGDSMGAGLILLIFQEDWKGIFLWDHCLELEQSTEEDCLYRIADNFDMFFHSLQIMDIEKSQ